MAADPVVDDAVVGIEQQLPAQRRDDGRDHHRHHERGAEEADPRQIDIQQQRDAQAKGKLCGDGDRGVDAGDPQALQELWIGQQVLIVGGASKVAGEQGLLRRPALEAEIQREHQRDAEDQQHHRTGRQHGEPHELPIQPTLGTRRARRGAMRCTHCGRSDGSRGSSHGPSLCRARLVSADTIQGRVPCVTRGAGFL